MQTTATRVAITNFKPVQALTEILTVTMNMGHINAADSIWQHVQLF